jgi:uncharacterized RmlC-like cupin family protein
MIERDKLKDMDMQNDMHHRWEGHETYLCDVTGDSSKRYGGTLNRNTTCVNG